MRLGALVIAEVAIATLLVASVPTVSAYIPEDFPTAWRVYGPVVDKLRINIFSDERAEFNALRAGLLDLTDWPVTKFEEAEFAAHPDLLLSPIMRQAGLRPLTFNFLTGAGLGIPLRSDYVSGFLKTRTDFATFQDGKFDNFQSTLDLTPEGIEARRGIAHLVDLPAYVTESLTTPGVVADCWGTAVMDGVDGCFGNDPKMWDPAHCGATGESCVSAFNIVRDTGLGGKPGPADIAAARSHLIAAGLKDSDGDGLFDFPGQRIRFAIRVDDENRLRLGNLYADGLDALFERDSLGNPVVERQFVNIAQASYVFLADVEKDWDIYTGGYVGSTVDIVNVVRNSRLASDACGGVFSIAPNNHGFACHPAADQYYDEVAAGCITLACYSAATKLGIDEMGKAAIDIMGFSEAGRFANHNGWTGYVNAYGQGVRGQSIISMRQKPGYVPSDPRFVPGGGDPTLLRTALRNPTATLNMFAARTPYEAGILVGGTHPGGGVYEGLLATNPTVGFVGAQDYYWGVTKTEEEFRVDPTSGEKTTLIRFHMRSDLTFHNGQPITPLDAARTALAFRDVPGSVVSGAQSLLINAVAIPPNIVEFTYRGNSLFHKTTAGFMPILPAKLWDTHPLGTDFYGPGTGGDGFICRVGSVRTCAGKPEDPRIRVGYDPVSGLGDGDGEGGTFIGSGMWVCSSSGTLGQGCSSSGNQTPGIGGTFLLRRNMNHHRCCPSANTPFERSSWADSNNDGVISVHDIACIAINFDRPHPYWDRDGNGTVDIGEVAIAALLFDTSLTGPFRYVDMVNIDPVVDPFYGPECP